MTNALAYASALVITAVKRVREEALGMPIFADKVNRSWRHDTRYNDTRYNDTRSIETQHSDILYNDTMKNDTQYKSTQQNDVMQTDSMTTLSPIIV